MKIKQALTRKLGPLPAWAWLAIAGVAIFLVRRGSGGGSSTQGAATQNYDAGYSAGYGDASSLGGSGSSNGGGGSDGGGGGGDGSTGSTGGTTGTGGGGSTSSPPGSKKKPRRRKKHPKTGHEKPHKHSGHRKPPEHKGRTSTHKAHPHPHTGHAKPAHPPRKAHAEPPARRPTAHVQHARHTAGQHTSPAAPRHAAAQHKTPAKKPPVHKRVAQKVKRKR